jgi:hypothetical protein
MEQAISITPVRTYADTFGAVTQLWLGTPSGRWGILLMAAVMAVVFSLSAPWWIGTAGGLFWAFAMWLFLLALQSWKIMQTVRREGASTFTFDEDGVLCRARTMEMRVTWSGMARVRMTKQRCFLYFTPRCAWFIRRDGMKPGEEASILGLAMKAGAKVEGMG